MGAADYFYVSFRPVVLIKPRVWFIVNGFHCGPTIARKWSHQAELEGAHLIWTQRETGSQLL